MRALTQPPYAAALLLAAAGHGVPWPGARVGERPAGCGAAHLPGHLHRWHQPHALVSLRAESGGAAFRESALAPAAGSMPLRDGGATSVNLRAIRVGLHHSSTCAPFLRKLPALPCLHRIDIVGHTAHKLTSYWVDLTPFVAVLAASPASITLEIGNQPVPYWNIMGNLLLWQDASIASVTTAQPVALTVSPATQVGHAAVRVGCRGAERKMPRLSLAEVH